MSSRKVAICRETFSDWPENPTTTDGRLFGTIITNRRSHITSSWDVHQRRPRPFSYGSNIAMQNDLSSE
jgi:hypothetical protein